jgi:VIT1/CCC1 family predicted Fe2+/Mn2+ transporter
MGAFLYIFLFFIQTKSVITFTIIYKVGFLIIAGFIIYIAVSCILNKDALKDVGRAIRKKG